VAHPIHLMVDGPWRRRLAALLAALALATAGSAQAVDVQGHRGARGLAPENTLAGFERAIGLGVTTLELDLGLTRDGVLVVHHDRRLNPDLARDASGRWLEGPTPTLWALSLAELQAFDVGRLRPGSATARAFPEQQPRDGERIPTLAALFDRVQALGATQLHFNLEIKVSPLAPDETAPPETLADALLALLRQRGLLARSTVQSFDWRVLAHLRRAEPALRLSALGIAALGASVPDDGRWTAGLRLAEHGGSPARMAKALGAQVWSPRHDTLDAAAVRQAQELGLKVVPWTVNAVADIERLLDLGVDGLISDHPERVLAALQRRGLRAAPLP
jgi:glycerophosphoryl diester phosphodiesterase